MRMKNRFLVTTAALLTGVSIASAQSMSGDAGERGTSAGSYSRGGTDSGVSRESGRSEVSPSRGSKSIRVIQRVLIDRGFLQGGREASRHSETPERPGA